jgi:hypothetical protein
MVEDVGDRADVQPDVDGVQHRTAGGHAEMRLHMRGVLGRTAATTSPGATPSWPKGGRQPVTRTYTRHRCRGRLPSTTAVRSGKTRTGADQVAERCQRHEVGRALLQPGFVLHPAHDDAPLKLRNNLTPVLARDATKGKGVRHRSGARRSVGGPGIAEFCDRRRHMTGSLCYHALRPQPKRSRRTCAGPRA